MFPLTGPSSLPHRIGIAARWPLGIARSTWEYLTRSEPVHRTETAGDRSDLPAPVTGPWADDRIQQVWDGVGPLLHRLYAVTVDGATTGPMDLMDEFAEQPNRGAPSYMAVFDKTRGRRGELAVGDEFVIRMPGPWNGPVRVIDVGEGSFLLATLDGHLEAGQIEFRARREQEALQIEIESRARSGDRVSNLLYDVIGVAREVQLTLWVTTLLRLAERSGGHVRDGVHVTTRRVPSRVAAVASAGD